MDILSDLPETGLYLLLYIGPMNPWKLESFEFSNYHTDMLRDLNFCPSEPPELLELHQFSISPTLRASFSFPQQKSTPLKRKRWNPKNHCQLNFGTSSSKLFFAGSMFQLKVNWGPGGVESWNPLQMIPRIPNPWVFFPLRIPKPPFAPNQQINQLVDFQLIKIHGTKPRLPDVSKS